MPGINIFSHLMKAANIALVFKKEYRMDKAN